MQRQETRMAEGVIYEGIGRPTPGAVEWVKQKLAARYTEKGRIQAELNKAEKVMGPLTQEQRDEAAEKMHLEGKVKNKVVATVVRDAIAGGIVATAVGAMVLKPDLRAKVYAKLGTTTMKGGESLSGSLASGAAKLREGSPGIFKKMLAGIVETAQKSVTGVTARSTEAFTTGTRKAILQLEKSALKSQDTVYKALENVSKLKVDAPEATRTAAHKAFDKAVDVTMARNKVYQDVASKQGQAVNDMANYFVKADTGYLKRSYNAATREGKKIADTVVRNAKKAVEAAKKSKKSLPEVQKLEQAVVAAEASQKMTLDTEKAANEAEKAAKEAAVELAKRAKEAALQAKKKVVEPA